jgi:hypothetical protein
MLVHNKSTLTRANVRSKHKLIKPKEGRWARSIDVPALTADIFSAPLTELKFTTRQSVHKVVLSKVGHLAHVH